MKIKTAKSGRVIVELDGYSEGYHAYIQGAITGTVSLPAKYAAKDQDTLSDIAKSCLSDANDGTDNRGYYGARIIRKAGKIQ